VKLSGQSLHTEEEVGDHWEGGREERGAGQTVHTHIYIPVHCFLGCLFKRLLQAPVREQHPFPHTRYSPLTQPAAHRFILPWFGMRVPTALANLLPTPLHMLFYAILLSGLIPILTSAPHPLRNLVEQRQLREVPQPANSTFHKCCRRHLFKDGEAMGGWCEQNATDMDLQPLLDSSRKSSNINSFVQCLFGEDGVEECCAGVR
jgi:hypothetical protein